MNTPPAYYAVIELMVRATEYNPLIGEYEWHQITDDDILVHTTSGTLKFPSALIRMQEWDPMMITQDQLRQIANMII